MPSMRPLAPAPFRVNAERSPAPGHRTIDEVPGVERPAPPDHHTHEPRQRHTTPAAYSVAMPTAIEAGLDTLAGLLGSAGNVLVLTGAGISTDSGIPDYRGADGTRRVAPAEYREFV